MKIKNYNKTPTMTEDEFNASLFIMYGFVPKVKCAYSTSTLHLIINTPGMYIRYTKNKSGNFFKLLLSNSQIYMFNNSKKYSTYDDLLNAINSFIEETKHG